MIPSPIKQTGKNYNTVDVMKFLCAFLVIAAHTQPLSFFPLLDRGLGLVNRIAVPYFFMASSFFFFSKTDTPPSFKKYAAHLLRLYLLWSAVYFPLTVSKWLADGNISFPEIARYIVRFFLLGSVIPLWFLIYLVYAVGIVSLLVRTIKIKGMLIIVVASYALGLILTTYSGLFREIPFLDTLIKAGQPVFGPLPGVFFAVPCTVIGFLIARKGTFSQKACLFGAIACFLFYGAECLFGLFVLQTESTVLWIFLLPFCFLIFMLTLQIELPTNQIYRKIRSIGIVLYVSHYFFVEIFSPFFAEGKFASLLLFVAVTAASVILAFLLLRGSKTTKFAWLRYFY